jgi:hypothetical protein
MNEAFKAAVALLLSFSAAAWPDSFYTLPIRQVQVMMKFKQRFFIEQHNGINCLYR